MSLLTMLLFLAGCFVAALIACLILAYCAVHVDEIEDDEDAEDDESENNDEWRS